MDYQEKKEALSKALVELIEMAGRYRDHEEVAKAISYAIDIVVSKRLVLILLGKMQPSQP